VARWRIRLGAIAERDFINIVAWTVERFGPRQAESYRATILAAIKTMEQGPEQLGSRSREDIGEGVRTLHVARSGRRGRHFILYRTDGDGVTEVVRILHDAMDLARHLPNPETGGA
jgi:toxin ParE1/3/4